MNQKENNVINNGGFIFSLTSVLRIILVIGTYAGLIFIISLIALALSYKDSDYAIRLLIILIFAVSAVVFLYFARFKAIYIDSLGNLKLLERIGDSMEIKSSDIQFFKIYKVSLFVTGSGTGIGQEDDWNVNKMNKQEVNSYLKHINKNEGISNFVYPVKLIAKNKKYYFMINEQIALDLEHMINNKAIRINNFQKSFKSKISQKIYGLILVGAIILICGIFVSVLLLG